MSRSYKTEGIIIKRRNVGETDKILTIFTKHYGKIRVIAKGIRKINSRKAGNLELFNYCSFVIAEGRNFDIIMEVKPINIFSSWRKSLKKVGLAYYFAELVDKLTGERQANKAVFELLKNFLNKLGQFTGDFLLLMRTFEENILVNLGFGVPPHLQNYKGSLKSYIEAIAEKEIHTPRSLLNHS